MKKLSIALFAGLMLSALFQSIGAAQAAKFNGQTLYNFCNVQPQCADGAAPSSALLAVNSLLYGTTARGGKGGTVCAERGCITQGTVFSLDPNTGIEKVLYAFCSKTNCADGADPSGVIEVNGLLYGATGLGGNQNCANGCGTVFSLDPNTGVENVLYSFCSQANCTDGQYPSAGLISIDGKLYGPTEMGGVTGCGVASCGTVFAIDVSTGQEKVVHAFCSEENCKDGVLPFGNLIEINGVLYGTTSFGGDYACQSRPVGCGVAFALDPNTGVLNVLHSFGNRDNEDAYCPGAGLIAVNGQLYGTAGAGGAEHAGAAFSLDPSTGHEAVIWSFCGTNCSAPSTLTELDGKLYGTLGEGGTKSRGIVFVLSKAH